MAPVSYHFEIVRCPICPRTLTMLRMLKTEGLLREVVEIDIEAVRSGDLIDRYNYFIKKALGGERRVPVMLIREKWYVPERTSLVGEVKGELKEEGEEEIGRVVKELEKQIRDDLKEITPSPRPYKSHELMLERAMHWPASSS